MKTNVKILLALTAVVEIQHRCKKKLTNMEGKHKTQGVGPKNQFLQDAAEKSESDLKKAKNKGALFDAYVDLGFMACVILGSVLMTFVISKFKKLRTRTNVYLKHYAIANLIVYVVKPILGFLLTLLHKDIKLTDHIDNCVVYNTDVFLLTLPLVFGFLLGIDYLIVVYFSKFSKWCSKLQPFVFFVIYLVYLIEFIAFQFECSYTLQSVDNTEACIISMVIVLAQSLLVCLKLCLGKRPHSSRIDFSWKVAQLIIFPWIFVFVFYFLPTLKYVDLEDYGYGWYLAINFILSLSQYGSAATLIFWLPFLDKGFFEAYKCLWLQGEGAVLLNDSDTDDDSRFAMYDFSELESFYL